MAVTFRLPGPRALDLVEFAWSPLFETVLSIPAIVHPQRTPMHLPWSRRCRDLPADLLEEITRLFEPFDCFVPGIFSAGFRGRSADFEVELALVESLDDDLVAYELALGYGGTGCEVDDDAGPERVHDPEFRRRVLDAAASDPGRAALAGAAFDDPRRLLERHVAVLRRYWDAAFAEEWDRLLPRIESEVTAGAHALVTGGVPRLVAELLPEGRWEDDSSSIVVEKTWDGECDVAARGGMLFIPTVYGWPKVLIDITPSWPVQVIFPLRELRRPAVPHASDAEVVDGFRALADQTRMQIARLVAEDARSTKELAELLSLSDSAISRHLKILESAGLVSSRRDGYFVLYALRPDRLDVLGRALRHTLGLAHAGAGDVPALPVSMARRNDR